MKGKPGLPGGRGTAWWSWSGLILLGTTQAILRWQFLPLGASLNSVLMPWLITRGFSLYAEIFDQRGPVVPYVVALGLQAIPEPLTLLRLLTAIGAVLTSGCVFVVGQHMGGARVAWIAVIFYAVWEPIFNGRSFYYEMVLGLLFVLAFLVWHHTEPSACGKPRPFLAGLILGLAVLVKQYGGFAIIGYAIWRLFIGILHRQGIRQIAVDLFLFTAGASLLSLVAIVWYAALQRLDEFVYWTWTFNFANYAGPAAQLPKLRDISGILPAYLLLPIFLAVVCLHRQRDLEQATLLVILFLASSTPAFPRFALFHLGAALPFLALISAQAVSRTAAWATGGNTPAIRPSRVPHRLWKPLIVGSLGVILLVNVSGTGAWYSSVLERYAKQGQPVYEYEDLIPIGRWVQQHTLPEEVIYLYPDTEATANTYVISDRLPPGMWIYLYPWYMNAPGMFERLIAHLEHYQPRLVIYFPYEGWHWAPMAEYVHAHYTRIATLPAKGSPEGIWIMQRKVGQTQVDMPAGPLQGSITIGQTFHSPYSGLHRIDIAMATYARVNTHDVIFHLRENPTATVDLATTVVNASMIEDNAWHRFEFAPVANSANRSFYFFLESPSSTPDDAVTVYGCTSDHYKAGQPYLNGQPAGGDLAFLAYYSVVSQAR